MIHRKNQALLKWQSRQTNNKTTQTKINKQRNENKLIKKMAAILHLITLVTKSVGEAHKIKISYSLPPQSETCNTVPKRGTEPIRYVTLHL